jgi:hypothetical protein
LLEVGGLVRLRLESRRFVDELRRTTAYLATLAVASAVAVFGFPHAAKAGNWGSTPCVGAPRNCVSLANNSYHAVRFFNIEDIFSIPGMAADTQWALTNVYNPTDLVAYRDEGDPLPDVWVSDDDYGGNGIVGWVECPTNHTGQGGAEPNRWCRGQQLRYNLWYYTHANGFLDTTAQRRFMSCHELGHTVGLRHRFDFRHTCMWQFAGDGGGTTIDGHERGHVNARY